MLNLDWIMIGRIGFTVGCVLIFLIILVGAWSKKSSARYQEIERDFLADEDLPHLKTHLTTGEKQ
jgi:cytochrome c oxidase cbb3-type subunit 4